MKKSTAVAILKSEPVKPADWHIEDNKTLRERTLTFVLSPPRTDPSSEHLLACRDVARLEVLMRVAQRRANLAYVAMAASWRARTEEQTQGGDASVWLVDEIVCEFARDHYREARKYAESEAERAAR
jgi:hypothetical protein